MAMPCSLLPWCLKIRYDSARSFKSRNLKATKEQDSGNFCPADGWRGEGVRLRGQCLTLDWFPIPAHMHSGLEALSAA